MKPTTFHIINPTSTPNFNKEKAGFQTGSTQWKVIKQEDYLNIVLQAAFIHTVSVTIIPTTESSNTKLSLN